jgi:hypothetical protein
VQDSLGSRRWASHFYHIDLPTQHVFEIEDETAEVEDGPAWLELDEEVDIAVGLRVSAGYGPEHANVMGPVPYGDCKKFNSTGPETGKCQLGPHPANGKPGPGMNLELDAESFREPRQSGNGRGNFTALQPRNRRLSCADPDGKLGLRQPSGPSGRCKRTTKGFCRTRNLSIHLRRDGSCTGGRSASMMRHDAFPSIA